MIHHVPPQSSGDSAVALADDPIPDLGAISGAQGLPGPISWELPDKEPVHLPETGGDFESAEAVEVGWSVETAETVEEPAPDPMLDLAGRGPAGETPVEPPLPMTADAWEVDEAPPAPAPVFPAVWSLGPVGRRRNIVLLAVLGALTLGLYTAAWFRRANREMREFDPRMYARPGRSAAAIVLPVILTLATAAAAGGRIVADHLGLGIDLPVAPSVTHWFVAAPAVAPWLVLLLPFSAVAAAMTMERVRVVEDRAGIPPNLQMRPVASLAWLLIPLAGIVVLAARAQMCLNRVWTIAVP